MALTLGTNCGFVSPAPVADPEATGLNLSGTAIALKVVAPYGATAVTEIGWWCDNATDERDFEVGLYTHDPGADEPEALIGKSAATAKGTTAGWKKVSGLSIPVVAGTTYWLAVQLDGSAEVAQIDYTPTVGQRQAKITSQTTLIDPWGTSASLTENLNGIYCLFTMTGGAAKHSYGSIAADELRGD